MNAVELLQYVQETAEMGILGLENVEGHAQNDALRRAVARQIAEYRSIADSARQMLAERGGAYKEPGWMARVSSEVMSAVKTMADPSASNIAEMVIQGNTMGITKGTRHLNDYAGDDDGARALAEKLLHTEELNVEQMKAFL